MQNRTLGGRQLAQFTIHVAGKTTPATQIAACDDYIPGAFSNGDVKAENLWTCPSYTSGNTQYLFWGHNYGTGHGGASASLETDPSGSGTVVDFHCHPPESSGHAIVLKYPITSAGIYTIDLLSGKRTWRPHSDGRFEVFKQTSGSVSSMASITDFNQELLTEASTNNQAYSASFAAGDFLYFAFSTTHWGASQALLRFRIRKEAPTESPTSSPPAPPS